MDQIGKTLMSLVRSALWGGPADAVDKDTDWNGVLLLAKQQTVLGLMAESVQNLPQELRPAEDISDTSVFIPHSCSRAGSIMCPAASIIL